MRLPLGVIGADEARARTISRMDQDRRRARGRRGTDAEPVAVITSAHRGLGEEQGSRTRRYLVSMAVRTACVIAAIVVPGWPRWAFLAGAVLLPMLAVVVANAGQSRDEPGPQDLLMPPRALGAAGGPATPSAAMPGTR